MGGAPQPSYQARQTNNGGSYQSSRPAPQSATSQPTTPQAEPLWTDSMTWPVLNDID